MYNNIKSCVVVNQELSEFFLSHKGVKHGENLSPLLFALYVNDLEEHLLNENCTHLRFNDQWLDLHLRLLILTYADDTVIIEESEERINHILRVLENYGNQWQMKINSCKTKVVVFGRGRAQTTSYDFKFKNEIPCSLIQL